MSSQLPSLASLPDAIRREVHDNGVHVTFPRHTTLFRRGDPGDALYVLQRGSAVVRVDDVAPRGASLHLIGPGEAFGELALLAPHGRRTASVVTSTGCAALVIPRHRFDALRSRHVEVDRFVIDVVAATIDRLTQQACEAMHRPAPRRVLARVHRIAARFGDGVHASVPITQQELAEMTGTTRPTVNAVLREAEDQGVVRLRRGSIDIVDLAALDAATR